MSDIKTYDLIVIGTGAGARIYFPAAELGLRVAVVEEGPFGGTCLNRGCIPSKMLIHSADIAQTIDTASTFGIKSKGYTVDFKKLVNRVSTTVDHDAASSRHGAENHPNITVYTDTAHFVGPKEISVGSETITAQKIFIAAGARSFVPPIPGLADTDYITSKEALRLTKQPKKLTIIGGGYIGCELGHFFGALGTKIQMIERNDILLDREDKDISHAFTKIFSDHYGVFFNHSIVEVSQKGSTFTVLTTDTRGKKEKLVSDQLLIATGIQPNSDILKVAEAGIEINKRGYIQVNEYLETSVKDVYAFGDIAGNFAFRHSANFEGEYLFDRLYGKAKDTRSPIDYGPMPHAIFSCPQIASVGMTEEQVKEKNIPYIVTKRSYMQTAMGLALNEQDGFIKFLVHKQDRTILGCHILGHDASTLIHEVVPLMRLNRPIDDILNAIHIHPALSELVQRGLWELRA